MAPVIGALVLAAVLQQGPLGSLPNAPGEWRQRIDTRVETAWDVTPAGAAAFNRKLAALAEIVHAAPVLQAPTGIQPRFTARWFARDRCSVGRGRPCRSDPVTGQLGLTLYWIFTEAGKPAWGGENNTSADIWVNDPEQTFGGTNYDVLGGPGYLPLAEASFPRPSAPPRFIKFQPRQTGVLPGGFAIYDSQLVVLTRPGTSAWVPVSREQYLKALIAHNQRELARVAGQQALPNDPYGKWLADAEARRQAREKTYQQLKKSSPSQAEQYLRTALDMEEKMGAGLKASAVKLAPMGDGAQLYRDIVAGLSGELAALSPEARASQAWWKRSEDLRQQIYGSQLVPAGTSEARPLVAFNPACIDLSRPNTDWQVIAIWLHWRQYRPDFIAVRKLFDFLEGTDWTRAAALLR